MSTLTNERKIEYPVYINTNKRISTKMLLVLYNGPLARDKAACVVDENFLVDCPVARPKVCCKCACYIGNRDRIAISIKKESIQSVRNTNG